MKVIKRTAASLAVLLVVASQASFAHQTLDAVVVTANPLGGDINDLVAPVSVLRGDELAKKQSSTLGETLNHLPGISSTNFGPNASRPVIRGLDGDRVRIMNNGGASLDVSSLSSDHAVAIDPLLVEQIEVVRGPAALQYGGSAIGGAVNIIDNRIPRSPVNGERFSTYIIKAARGSGAISLNGAAARKAHVGDLLIICTYGSMTETDAKTFIPKVILVDEKNKIKEIKKITI